MWTHDNKTFDDTSTNIYNDTRLSEHSTSNPSNLAVITLRSFFLYFLPLFQLFRVGKRDAIDSLQSLSVWLAFPVRRRVLHPQPTNSVTSSMIHSDALLKHFQSVSISLSWHVLPQRHSNTSSLFPFHFHDTYCHRGTQTLPVCFHFTFMTRTAKHEATATRDMTDWLTLYKTHCVIEINSFLYSVHNSTMLIWPNSNKLLL